MTAILSGVVAALALSASPAAAATRDDPDDVGGKLDLRQVTRTFSNGPSAPPLVHLQATTYDGWSLRECAQVDACSIVVELDARRGPAADVAVFWDVDERRQPSCTVHNARTGRLLASGDASKFRRSAFCSFPKRVLEGDKPVRWRFHSLWGLIVDHAPDRGWF